MKKFIYILSALLLFTVVAESQTMRQSDSFFSRTVNTTVDATDSIWVSAPVNVNKEYPFVVDFGIAIDSLNRAADDTIFIKLQGRIFENSDWADIETVNNLLPTAATFSTGSKVDDALRYRQLRIYASSKDKDSNWKVTTYMIKLHKGVYNKPAE
jgi:hypothetical protein